MTKSVGHMLGLAVRRLSNGDWVGAAAMLNAQVWAGRYVGCFVTLWTSIAIRKWMAGMAGAASPEIASSTGSDVVVALFGVLLIPAVLLWFGIWIAYRGLGGFGPRIRATTFFGGCLEGAIFGAIGVAAYWLLEQSRAVSKLPVSR